MEETRGLHLLQMLGGGGWRNPSSGPTYLVVRVVPGDPGG